MYESDYDGNCPALAALMDLIFCVDIIYQPIATNIRGPHYVVNYNVLFQEKYCRSNYGVAHGKLHSTLAHNVFHN